MNEYKLERIKERRAELRSEANLSIHGLSFEGFTIAKLVDAELAIAHLEARFSALETEFKKLVGEL